MPFGGFSLSSEFRASFCHGSLYLALQLIKGHVREGVADARHRRESLFPTCLHLVEAAQVVGEDDRGDRDAARRSSVSRPRWRRAEL